MCVAIFQKPGVKISMDKLDEGARCNADGSGYAYVDETQTVRIRKSLKWENIRKQFENDVEKYGETSPFIIHHRIKSHGAISKENCHPFHMKDGGAIIHNGIITIPAIPEEYSDTRWFVEQIIDNLPRRWERSIEWCMMVEKMIGVNSKMVGLWPDNAYFIFNESAGHWEDDEGVRVYGRTESDIAKQAAWFSNASCNLPVHSNPKVHTNTGNTGGNSAWRRPTPIQNYQHTGDDDWIVNANGTRTYRRSTKTEDASGDKFLANSGKTIIEKYCAGSTTADAAFQREMLANGLCPECGEDYSTDHRAVIHLVYQCQKMIENNPLLVQEMIQVRRRMLASGYSV